MSSIYIFSKILTYVPATIRKIPKNFQDFINTSRENFEVSATKLWINLFIIFAHLSDLKKNTSHNVFDFKQEQMKQTLSIF